MFLKNVRTYEPKPLLPPTIDERVTRLEKSKDFLVDVALAVGLGVLVLVDVFTSGRR
jgi:hypothetical protein